MPGGSLLVLACSREGHSYRHQACEWCQAPLIHYQKDKKCHFPIWTAGNLISEMYDSWKAFSWALQISSRKLKIGKINLPQNNEVHAEANHKVRILITWCFRLSMHCAHLALLKPSFWLRATVNWVSEVNLFSCTQSLAHQQTPLPLEETWAMTTSPQKLARGSLEKTAGP